MSGFPGMNEFTDPYRRHRVNIERILEQTPSEMEMFGPVAEASRRLRLASNGELAEQLYRIAEQYPETFLLMDEVCSRLSAVGEIATEAELGTN